MRLRFKYTDASGHKTERTVSDVMVKNEFYIMGYCEMRQEGRTFALGSMTDIVDADSGVAISDIEQALGMLNKNGAIKKKYVDNDGEYPEPFEFKCKACLAVHELDYFWALHHTNYDCSCGMSYSIARKKKGA